MAMLRIVKINDYSDGDARHIPNTSSHRQYTPPELYLEKLGTEWMKSLGKAQPGFKYRLERLPDGYTVWEKPRQDNPSRIDRWCFGHPSKRPFDSPNRFLPHFLNLMEKGSAQGCTCIHCDKTSKPARSGKVQAVANTSAPRNTGSRFEKYEYTLPTRTSVPPPIQPAETVDLDQDETASELKTGVYKSKGRQWVEGRTDEEGTPDPYRNNIDRLKALGSLDTLIEEPMSADWRAERACHVDRYFKQLKQKSSWLPRRMEIVLIVRELHVKEKITFSPEHKRFMIVSERDGSTSKQEPLWEAGVVTQTPLTEDKDDRHGVTSSGFRVEPLSDANSKEGKGVWKRYSYLRYDQIRPFNLWKNMLAGVDHDQWDDTIRNALLVMSTLTLVKRYRFKGKWPEAKVFCRGMYLGAELIVEGDFVYLLPESEFDKGVTDIMLIESITLDMWNLDKASSDDYDDGHPYNCAARITGKIYTNSEQRANDPVPIEFNDSTTGLNRVGPWYARTPEGRLARVPFRRVMGRCHNPNVVDIWIHGEFSPDEPLTSPGLGLSGVREARKYCSEEYRRIDDGREWFWADTRVEALDLEEVNGLLVSSQDPERDPKKYRKEIRVIEGTARPDERRELQQADRRASGRVMNSMVASAFDLEGEAESAETSRIRKRSRSALGGSESGEDEENMDQNEFADQIAEGLAMSDEEIPSGSEDEEDDDDDGIIAAGTQVQPSRGSVPVVIID